MLYSVVPISATFHIREHVNHDKPRNAPLIHGFARSPSEAALFLTEAYESQSAREERHAVR